MDKLVFPVDETLIYRFKFLEQHSHCWVRRASLSFELVISPSDVVELLQQFRF